MNARRRIDSFWLKIIALATMTTDHIAAALPCGQWYLPMRCIGRIAFPIYCFLLAEGFCHTRSRGRYLLRLCLLFLLSEPVYDLVFHQGFPYWGNQNILLTLALGLGTVWLVDAADRLELWALRWPVKLLACGLGLWLSEALFADYGWGGILLILSFCFFRGKPVPLCAAVSCSLVLAIGIIEVFGLLALLPILLYSGKQGDLLQKPWFQYAFYFYYPVHIAVLWLVQLML